MNESPMEQIPPTQSDSKPRMKKSIFISTLIAVLVIAGGGGFFGGMRYEKQKLTKNPQELFSSNGSNTNRQFPGFPGGSNSNRSMRGGGIGGATRGTIASISGTNMTVTLSDGSSKIVIVPSSATISKSTTATSADLTTGQTVMVTGTTNSDGSVTAENIQLNPATLTIGEPPAGDIPTTPAS